MDDKSYEVTVELKIVIGEYISEESAEEVERDFNDRLFVAVVNGFGDFMGGHEEIIKECQVTASEN